MIHNNDFQKINEVKFTGFIAVVEYFRKGYVMAITDNVEEATSQALKISTHFNVNEDVNFNDLINYYNWLATYEVNGNAHFISNWIWSDVYGQCEVYVIGINKKDGGIIRFIRERQYCSEFISMEDHMNRYQRAIEKFKRFGFGAN